MKAFINRPIPRLLRYELLLKQILGETSVGSEDRGAIPQVIEVISALAKDTEPGVASAKQKVELWKYNSNLVFKPGESVVCTILPLVLCYSRLLSGPGPPQRTAILATYWKTASTT